MLQDYVDGVVDTIEIPGHARDISIAHFSIFHGGGREAASGYFMSSVRLSLCQTQKNTDVLEF